ncbi:hypothetical protein [Undibacterium squillarum]|uniref:hypothetical protein n=1 Tax=Undibacterium squillarum TaxID=1131567 RepID=UPI0035AE1F7F
MSYIRFSYLYRDAGNNKNFGSVIFANRHQHTQETLRSSIQRKLIDNLYFDAIVWQIPTLHFAEHDPELDHGWHEFDDVSVVDHLTELKPNRDIEDLCQL